MDADHRQAKPDKEQAARDFVRSVLVTSFKQNADDETVNLVAAKVLKELTASPAAAETAD